jgi:hypothetical protein
MVFIAKANYDDIWQSTRLSAQSSDMSVYYYAIVNYQTNVPTLYAVNVVTKQVTVVSYCNNKFLLQRVNGCHSLMLPKIEKTSYDRYAPNFALDYRWICWPIVRRVRKCFHHHRCFFWIRLQAIQRTSRGCTLN